MNSSCGHLTLQVKTAKPMVDTTAPKQHPHVVSKQKKEQVDLVYQLYYIMLIDISLQSYRLYICACPPLYMTGKM